MDDDGATEIVRTTHRARCKHGYADLTDTNVGADAAGTTIAAADDCDR